MHMFIELEAIMHSLCNQPRVPQSLYALSHGILLHTLEDLLG